LKPAILACGAALLAATSAQPCAAQIVTDSDQDSDPTSEAGGATGVTPASDAAAATSSVPQEDWAIAEQAARIKTQVLERTVPAEAPPARAGHDEPKFDHPADLDGKDKRERKWYGWQILISDGASAAMFLGSIGGESSLIASGAVGYLVVPPIIHAAHRRGGVGWGSLGIRVGTPLLGLMVASASESDSGTAVGLAIGMMGAIAIDAAALAWERRATIPSRHAPAAHPELP
jgi:hypothetical protein